MTVKELRVLLAVLADSGYDDFKIGLAQGSIDYALEQVRVCLQAKTVKLDSYT